MSKPEGIRRSQAQERRIARANDGRVQSGSGNGKFAKEDVRLRSAGFLVQGKVILNPQAKSFSVKLSDLVSLERHAAQDSLDAIFEVEVGGRTWWVVSAWVGSARLGIQAR